MQADLFEAKASVALERCILRELRSDSSLSRMPFVFAADLALE
jgi:hypothetical protein